MTPRKPAASPSLSRACFEGRHKDCGRHVLLPEPDADGNIYRVCSCPVCRHVPDYRRVR
jgi:hypothetical protein